jgi:ribonuclease J
MSHMHLELSAPPALPEGGLRVIPLGGLGEIGRNMTSFEYGGKIVIVDCGVLFPEETQPGVDLILPDFGPIRDRLKATRTTSAACPTCCASAATSPSSAPS